MAIVTKTIKPSSGDYTTLTAWESTEQTDLPTDGDSHVAECYIFSGGLSDTLTVDGWTTGASNTIEIKASSGEEHDGTPKSGFYVEKSDGFVYLINILQDYTSLESIDVENTHSSGHGIKVMADTAGQHGAVSRCIAKAGGSNRNCFLIDKGGTFINCLAYGPGFGFVGDNFFEMQCFNCTAAGLATGFWAPTSGAAGAPMLKNCVAYDCTTNYSDGGIGWDAACTHNATSTGSDDAPGGDSQISVVSGDFEDAGSDDYRVASGSAKLKDNGTDLSGVHSFDDDCVGNTRSGSWDIGWHEHQGGDVNVGASTDALTLTTYQASVALDVDIGASTDALTLTALQASVALDANVGAGVDALTLTEYAAAVSLDVNVGAATDALTLTTYQASLGADTDISANVDALTLTTYSAAIANDVNVGGIVDALTLTTYQSDVTLGVNVLASVDALTLTEYVALIANDVEVSAFVDTLTLATYKGSVVGGAVVSAVRPGGVRAKRRRIVVDGKHYIVASQQEERRIVEAYIKELEQRKADPTPIKVRRKLKLARARFNKIDQGIKAHQRKTDEETLLLLMA